MPPKKGRDKAGGGPPAKASGSSGKKKASTAAGSTAPADSDFIVFTNSTGEGSGRGKGRGGGGGGGSGGPPAKTEADGPPKPTVKQIIGGASWTGKLPVNLLSEHCQKQKWERPDYDVRKNKEGFSAFVSLSAKNHKTGEMTKLEPFKLPPSHAHLAMQATALEARHFAATYGLFRVCSMKNLHMMLPPAYKELWRTFGTLKAEDVQAGKAWLYDADPFATLRDRAAAKAAAEKKRAELQAAREKAASQPGAAGLSALGGGGGGGGGSGSKSSNPMKGWTHVPKIEMGGRTRSVVEDLLRRASVWNAHGVTMAASARTAVVEELSRLGFRRSHVEEAAAACKDREETLEWLLVHVPEDDLPRWALPESYTAGVSVAATDLRREGAIGRLAQGGYATDLVRKVLDASGGDEGVAAAALQAILTGDSAPVPALSVSYASADEAWEAELASLESVYGSALYARPSADVCAIQIADVVDGPRKAVETTLQFRRSARYPAELLVAVVAPQLPAYIRLSIARQALAYAAEALADEEMKLFYVVDWVQQHVNAIVARPGPLRDIAAAASAASEPASTPSPTADPRRGVRRAPRQPAAVTWTEDADSRRAWQQRQDAPALQKMISQRKLLPAWGVRATLVATVRSHQVTIVAGETGSGKSTQAVQFVLDDLYGRGLGGQANIVVTQPRRISALGLADRVAEERCSRVGDEVGYTIRGESRTTRGKTRITFVTTGVLLRRLQMAGSGSGSGSGGSDMAGVVAALADVSHVVIDEVHERSLDTDFLLCLLRDVLRARADLKLVLMSATLDAATFCDYFASEGLSVGAVEIAGRTFPVDDLYLDDVIRATGFGLDATTAASPDDDTVRKAIQKIGSRVHYGLVADTVRAIDEELAATGETGGILVFLPGVAEISQVCSLLRSDDVSSLHVLPLHASLDTKEQRRVFVPPPAGRRKVVVATNVAETSITIDDIVAVVDSGRVKETTLDPQTSMRRLEDTWVSQAAAKQRRGRAGRVRPGKCYKLYTQQLEEAQMPARPEPEMRRVPLEQLCLAVRAMGVADVAGFLARAPTPPAVAAVEAALSLLRRMGVLDGDALALTALGRQLAAIPADLRCGKLIVLGALFGCLHPCVTVAAILSAARGSPFVTPPPDRRDDARAARARFSHHGDGDLLTDLAAVLRWDALVAQEGGRVHARAVRAFCDDCFLSPQALADIAATRTQLYAALRELRIIRGTRDDDGQAGNHLLLRALTAAAFAPQIVRIQLPDQKFAAGVSGTVALDPEARTIRYFARDHGRVFVHPSSTLFDSQAFTARAAFLSYFRLMATSKVFIRDLTPLNAYTLLLFSGPIELDTLGRGLVVDGWLRLRGWARIGVLVARLRQMVDHLIARRIGAAADNPSSDSPPPADPSLDDDIIKAVIKLIELDGLDA